MRTIQPSSCDPKIGRSLASWLCGGIRTRRRKPWGIHRSETVGAGSRGQSTHYPPQIAFGWRYHMAPSAPPAAEAKDTSQARAASAASWSAAPIEPVLEMPDIQGIVVPGFFKAPSDSPLAQIAGQRGSVESVSQLAAEPEAKQRRRKRCMIDASSAIRRQDRRSGPSRTLVSSRPSDSATPACFD